MQNVGQAITVGNLRESFLLRLRILLLETTQQFTLASWFLSSPFTLLCVVTHLMVNCMLILVIMENVHQRNAQITVLVCGWFP